MTEATSVSAMPVVQLANGLRVANFSSPHPFEFETGETLPACDPELVKASSLQKNLEERPSSRHLDAVDVEVRFEMSDSCRALLEEAESQARKEGIHVILIPFPLLDVLRRERDVAETPFRVILVEDRVTKKISSRKFCV